MKYIGVFCSSQEVDQKYVDATRKFGKLMAENGYNLVWGGSDRGLMKVIADAVEEGGGELYGVSISTFNHILRNNVKNMILAKDLGDRKAAMLEKSDLIVTLVGGIGTLDELTDIIELRKIGMHQKPIVILNTDNFYEGLKMIMDRMEREGFLNSNLEKDTKNLVYFANTPEEAIDYINKQLK